MPDGGICIVEPLDDYVSNIQQPVVGVGIGWLVLNGRIAKRVLNRRRFVFSLSISVCVCVCVRERERERNVNVHRIWFLFAATNENV